MDFNRLPKVLLPAIALSLGALLLFHPQFDGGVYEGLRDITTRWIVVHIGLAIGAALMTVAAYTLIDGLPGRPAKVSRYALAIFPVFFIAWEATLGIGTGLMVEHANDLAPADRGPTADAIQSYFDDPVLFGLSVIGNMAWIVAMISAAIAFHRAGAGRSVTTLVGLSSLFVLHDAGPVGAMGLACFAAAAILIARQARGARAQTMRSDGVALGLKAP